VGGFRRCRVGLRLLGFVTASVVGASARCDVTGAEKRAPRVRLRDGVAAAAVENAIEQARRRLAEPECRKLLSDFTDASGRSLQAVLDDLQSTPEEYVSELFFYDGSSHKSCRAGRARAVTAPGSRVVLVCGREFARVRVSRPPGGYDFVVIHEMLHSLGLGEDPPSSSEINARVRARCGH